MQPNQLIRGKVVLWSIMAFFALVYTTQVVLNHYYFRTYALDYGYYNQAFWDFAHFRVNANSVMEPQLSNYFQIHPGFTLLLLSPLYWLFNPIFGTYSLLIIQNIFILLGGYGVYLLVRQKTENYWIAVLAFLHYNLLWGHYSALSADFIETTVASSMVPLFFLFFDRKKYFLAGIFFLFVIVCKENMPIWFIFISLTLILTYKDKRSRIVALGIGVFSFLYLVFLFKFLIPHFENPDLPYGGFAYSALGKDPGEAVMHIIRHPVDTFRLLFINQSGDSNYDNIKAEFYIVFLLSGGVLLFWRPVYLIPFIPLIAQKMFNDSYGRWGILGFYSIEAVSLLTLAVFIATAGIKNIKIRYILYGLLCISTLRITIVKMEHRTSLYYDASKENMLSSSFYRAGFDPKKISTQIREIVPADSPLAASQGIVPHGAYRSRISMFPYVHDADYIVLLLEGSKYPLGEESFKKEMEKYLHNPEWKQLLNDYPLIILKRL
jgi:uncharacterized membrane protein